MRITPPSIEYCSNGDKKEMLQELLQHTLFVSEKLVSGIGLDSVCLNPNKP